MKLRNLSLLVAATAALAACSDEDLGVVNLTSPDVERSLSTPDGIEAILKNGFVQVFGATHGTTSALWPQALVLSFESFGTVANNGMALRSSLPRVPIDNQKGNQTAGENARDFTQLALRGRNVNNAIRALDALVAGGGGLGSTTANLRARSFGFFSLALANGEAALMYDSLGVITPNLESSDVPELSGYAAAMDTALMQLDTAIVVAQAAMAAGSLSFPNDWLRTVNTPVTGADYIKLLRSHKARLRAGVARTPEERAAVDWAAVEADAAAGITEDFTLDLNSALGWGASWVNQMANYTGWSSMPNFIAGFADTTSEFQAWLGTPINSRRPFLIRTPDKRWPAGETRAAQQASSPTTAAVLPTVYFRNRPTGDDTPGVPYGDSYYDHARFRHYRVNSSVGPWIWMEKTENDMLRAEALIRLNRVPEAVPLINITRVVNGLPAITAAGATAATRVPPQPGGGATSCVPRTPTGASNALECGTVLEAMKWEKRMETAWTGYSQWFIDGRGWGDFAVGTTYMWPVPYQEMDARVKPFYNSPWQTTASTYGY